MAAKARARSRDFSRQFWSVLRHAFSECCLIIMLLVTAVVSYTATRFARICRIRSPCMLCSRLDLILHGKAWFSEELVCAAHRLEISHLSYCQSHNKLAHSDDMCKACLRSCTGLVGNKNLTSARGKEKVNSRSRSKHEQLCSCCSQPFNKTRSELFEHANDRVPDDDMTKVKERSVSMESAGDSSDEGFDDFSYGGYKKLKRDSESDDDDDDGNAMPLESIQQTKDISCHDVQLQPMISSANSLFTLDNISKSSDPSIRHSLEEINWSQANVDDKNDDLQSKAVPKQACAGLPKERTFLVGIEEIGDSDGVSGIHDEEGMKNFAASEYAATSLTTDNRINRNNSMKNASGGRHDIQSPRWSEVMSVKDTNSRTQEEVKTFLSQLSSARGFDGPWSEVNTSPRISMLIDEYKQTDATGSQQFLQSSNSNLEPFDVHVTSEDEGEISLECLKQQVQLDKKKMSILYKELEAERSASAVAASEAMAMINRLQEEKAAMHMEALQYLRMMEEQADHDQEAIEKLNDLLTEREKEMLDLEAELENYRRMIHNEPFDVRKFDAGNGGVPFEVLSGSDFMRNTMFDFENEKAKILESLSRLEETLGMSPRNRLDLGGTKDDLHNCSLGDHSRGGKQYMENPEVECGTSLLSSEHLNNESVPFEQNNENQSIENQKDLGPCSHLDDENISAITNVKHEVSLLNSRFKALEADQKFLRQILNSLKCSDDGIQYVQEITSHLRELRRTVTEQRGMPVL